MPHVVSRHGSGLLVAADAVDERAITHALAQIPNPHGRLILDLDHNEQHQCLEYKVRLLLSSGEAPFVTSWRDDNDRPLPLSFALIDHVKMLIETDTLRAADAHNERVREQAKQELADEADAITAETMPWAEGRRQHFGVYKREKPGRMKHLTLRESAAARARRESQS